jgi:hypothetical protein
LLDPLPGAEMRHVREAFGGGAWWICLALFAIGLVRLWLPAPAGPPPGYVTVGAGVLTVALIRNWILRIVYASAAWLTSLLAIEVAPCTSPYAHLSSCERLSSVHLLVSLSIALGLLVALRLALDPRPTPRDRDRSGTGS